MSRQPLSLVKRLVRPNPNYVSAMAGAILRKPSRPLTRMTPARARRASKAGHRALAVKRLIARYRLLEGGESK